MRRSVSFVIYVTSSIQHNNSTLYVFLWYTVGKGQTFCLVVLYTNGISMQRAQKTANRQKRIQLQSLCQNGLGVWQMPAFKPFLKEIATTWICSCLNHVACCDDHFKLNWSLLSTVSSLFYLLNLQFVRTSTCQYNWPLLLCVSVALLRGNYVADIFSTDWGFLKQLGNWAVPVTFKINGMMQYIWHILYFMLNNTGVKNNVSKASRGWERKRWIVYIGVTGLRRMVWEEGNRRRF